MRALLPSGAVPSIHAPVPLLARVSYSLLCMRRIKARVAFFRDLFQDRRNVVEIATAASGLVYEVAFGHSKLAAERLVVVQCDTPLSTGRSLAGRSFAAHKSQAMVVRARKRFPSKIARSRP